MWVQYVYQLEEMDSTGIISERRLYLNRSLYEKPPELWKKELDVYLNDCSSRYTPRTLKLARAYCSEGIQVEVFEHETRLAEGLIIKKIGGHSIGSSIVLCKCGQKSYLFCGDECYVKECFTNHTPTGASFDTTLSEKFISDYDDGRYELLMFHDPEIMKGSLGYIEIGS